MNRICQNCEWSEKLDFGWKCQHGRDTTNLRRKCDGFWCAPIDKVAGTHHRESTCLICGKPIYSKTMAETPIYCYEHRAYAKADDKIIEEAPMELLFVLIAEIFQRAKDDYINNTDGQRSDAEVFMRGSWAQELSYEGFDAEAVLEGWRDLAIPWGHTAL